jgi:hypothetical protein
MAGQLDEPPLLHIPFALAMNFRHQRTCGVKDRQSKRRGFVLDRAGNAIVLSIFPGLDAPEKPLLLC